MNLGCIANRNVRDEGKDCFVVLAYGGINRWEVLGKKGKRNA